MIAAMAALCGDDELGYLRARTVFVPGRGFALDENYRLAHLPLVAPDHPNVIASKPAAPYRRGLRPAVASLTLHVPDAPLAGSPAFAALESELRRASFGAKIAWDMIERRRDRLHATICGSLNLDARGAARLDPEQIAAIAAIGSFDVELRGLFSGEINLGRLYLRAYPTRRNGENVLRMVQRVLRRPESDLHLVGVWNLIDDLTARQTADLARLIEEWWSRPIARVTVERLRVLISRDDLALDGEFAEDAALAPR